MPTSLLRSGFGSGSVEDLAASAAADQRQREYQDQVAATLARHNRQQSILANATRAATYGTIAGGVGSAVFGGGAVGGAGSNVSGPAGWTPGWEGNTNLIGGGLKTAAGGVGSRLLGSMTGRDLASLGSAGIGALTNIYGTNKANSAAEAAAAEQRRQFEEQQKFLEEQARIKRDDDLAVEAEKKRQWEAEQAEKLRRYEAQQPWRDAGQQNLVRMSSLLDRPKPMPVVYHPSFT